MLFRGLSCFACLFVCESVKGALCMRHIQGGSIPSSCTYDSSEGKAHPNSLGSGSLHMGTLADCACNRLHVFASPACDKYAGARGRCELSCTCCAWCTIGRSGCCDCAGIRQVSRTPAIIVPREQLAARGVRAPDAPAVLEVDGKSKSIGCALVWVITASAHSRREVRGRVSCLVYSFTSSSVPRKLTFSCFALLCNSCGTSFCSIA
jgi:hypothetical protein